MRLMTRKTKKTVWTLLLLTIIYFIFRSILFSEHGVHHKFDLQPFVTLNKNYEKLNVFIIMCRGDDQKESQKQLILTETLIKTLFIWTSKRIHVNIVNNDQQFFGKLLESLTKWKVSIKTVSTSNGFSNVLKPGECHAPSGMMPGNNSVQSQSKDCISNSCPSLGGL